MAQPMELESLLHSQKYSDLTITCGQKTFYVHRAIICPQSDFFGKACDGHFKEATTRVIDLVEDDPEDVERMISYFYKQIYEYPDIDLASIPPEYSESSSTHDEMLDVITKASSLQCQLVDAAMYALAEKLLVPGLNIWARYRFRSRNWSEWVHGAPEVIRAVYTTTSASDTDLRQHVARACVRGRVDLNSRGFREVFEELPEAHVDILRLQLAAGARALETVCRQKDTEKTGRKEAEEKVRSLEAEKEKLEVENQSLQQEHEDREGEATKRESSLIQYVRQLETENARLAQAKRQAEEDAAESYEKFVDEREWGEMKYDGLLRKINIGFCRGCEGYFGVRVDVEDNDYRDDRSVRVRCNHCNRRH